MDNRKYLYHARINQHLTLQQLGARTALSPTVLRNIDEGCFERLPSGIYARAYIRTFAGAVGLDPEEALSEVEQFLPETPDPVARLNEVKGSTAAERAARAIAGLAARCSPFRRQTAATDQMGASAEVLSTRTAGWHDGGQLVAGLAARCSPFRRQAAATDQMGASAEVLSARTAGWHDEAPLDAVEACGKGRKALVSRMPAVRRLRMTGTLGLDPQLLTRCSAAAIDALVLLAVNGCLLLLISWSSGLDVQSLLTDAGWALGALCAMPIALYFLLFGGIAGSTLGRYACSLMDPSPDRPLTLPDILRRAVLR